MAASPPGYQSVALFSRDRGRVCSDHRHDRYRAGHHHHACLRGAPSILRDSDSRALRAPTVQDATLLRHRADASSVPDTTHSDLQPESSSPAPRYSPVEEEVERLHSELAAGVCRSPAPSRIADPTLACRPWRSAIVSHPRNRVPGHARCAHDDVRAAVVETGGDLGWAQYDLPEMADSAAVL